MAVGRRSFLSALLCLPVLGLRRRDAYGDLLMATKKAYLAPLTNVFYRGRRLVADEFAFASDAQRNFLTSEGTTAQWWRNAKTSGNPSRAYEETMGELREVYLRCGRG